MCAYMYVGIQIFTLHVCVYVCLEVICCQLLDVHLENTVYLKCLYYICCLSIYQSLIHHQITIRIL